MCFFLKTKVPRNLNFAGLLFYVYMILGHNNRHRESGAEGIPASIRHAPGAGKRPALIGGIQDHGYFSPLPGRHIPAQPVPGGIEVRVTDYCHAVVIVPIARAVIFHFPCFYKALTR